MKVAALIVTYSDRFELCKQIIDSCLLQNVAKVILVSNNSSVESLNCYRELVLVDNRVELIIFEENKGSAGGYAAALKKGYGYNDLQYFWLLDDDNLPLPDALKSLLAAKQLLDYQNESNSVLYSYRGSSWFADKKSVSIGQIKEYGYNNFCGFSFCNSLFNLIRKNISYNTINYPLIKTKIGPYGGMFLSREIVFKIGYPNEDLFLYADDLEYSTRIQKNGLSQYLVFSSKINDIDESYNGENSFFSMEYSSLKLFYGLRNHTYLSKLFIKNKNVYYSNKLTFFTLILFRFMLSVFLQPAFAVERLKLIFRAISDGENDRLGKTF